MTTPILPDKIELKEIFEQEGYCEDDQKLIEAEANRQLQPYKDRIKELEAQNKHNLGCIEVYSAYQKKLEAKLEALSRNALTKEEAQFIRDGKSLVYKPNILAKLRAVSGNGDKT